MKRNLHHLFKKTYQKFSGNLRLLIVISLILVAVATVYLFQKHYLNPKASLPENSTLSQFISQIKLPPKDSKVERITKKLGDYQLKVASSSATDQTVQFGIKEATISFTPLANRSLGGVNEVKAEIKNQNDNKITYQNIYNGINLIYTTSKDKLLEEYEVKTKRDISEFIQKINLKDLEYKKLDDGSIAFSSQTSKKPLFYMPKPVMYEKFNTMARNYSLHYEVVEQNGNQYLLKVIDKAGDDWLKQAHYPVMIDGTVVTSPLSLESYPVSLNTWQVRIDTIGTADLTLTPSSTDMTFQSLTCDNQPISTTTAGNSIKAVNFSCSGAAVASYNLTKAGTYTLTANFSGEIQSVSTTLSENKPVFLSINQTPLYVQPGQTITVTAHVTDNQGIQTVKAKLGDTLPTIDLTLESGTINDGIWKGTWVAEGTQPIYYQTFITATNTLGLSTTSDPILWSDWTDTGGGDHGGADWTISTDTSIAGIHTNIGTFTVNNTITATVQAYSGGNYGSVNITATTVTITGTLTAAGAGYGALAGPGAGGNGGYNGAGGGYGGVGGNNSEGAAGGGVYGSSTAPVDLGSGGGNGFYSSGGSGGGAIRITASGTVTVSGTVSANGNVGTNPYGYSGGGGSGGSIYLTTATFTGSGTITANGGNGLNGVNAGGGGGGRIAIYYTSSSWAGNTLDAANAAVKGTGGTGGANGTVIVSHIFIWDGGGADGTCGGSAGDGNKWSCGLNWTGDTAPSAATDSIQFDSTSTKNATVDASFGGTVLKMDINSGYTGTITQARSLTVTELNQADGTFDGADQMLTVSGNFIESGGTFTQGTYTTDTLLTNLVGYWNMDEASGTNVADSSGNSNDGTAVTPTVTAGGKLNNARSFGAGDIITHPVNNFTTSARTISMWVKPNWNWNDGVAHGLWQNNNNTNINQANWVSLFKWTSNNLYWRVANPSGGLQDCAPVATSYFTSGSWTHIVASYDSAGQYMYINGSANVCGGGAITVPNANLDTTARIGFGHQNAFVSGIIDDVRIYNRVLTSAEITALAAGNTTSYTPTLDINGNFTQSGGTFNASSKIVTVAKNFTISGGTFNKSTGTVTIDGTSASTLACNNTSFNAFAITKDTNTTSVTVGSDCSLPLGASPTVTAALTSSGTLSGTGTLTLTSGATSTHTFNTGASLSGFSGLTSTGIFTIAGGTINLGSATSATFNQAFNISSGSFTAPATGTSDFNSTISITGGTFTAPNASGTMTAASDFTLTQGVFNANSGTVTFDSSSTSTLACNSAVFNKVAFSKVAVSTAITVGNGCSIPLGDNPSSTGAITNSGVITVGTTGWTLTGSYTSNNGATLTMGGTALTVSDNLTITAGIFPANLNLTLNTGDNSTVTCTVPTTFNTLAISKTSATPTATFGANCTGTLGNSVTSTGTITNNGTLNTGTGTWTITGSYTNGTTATLTDTLSAFAISGSLTVSGGTFPSGKTLTLNGASTQTITSTPTLTFSSITLNNTGGNTTFNANITDTGNFTRTDGVIANSSAAYTINIGGDFVLTTTDTVGSSAAVGLTFTLNGTGAQNITNTNAAAFYPNLIINKSSGTATLTTAFTVTSGKCAITSGTLDLAGFNLTCGGGLSVENNATLKLIGSESVTPPTLNQNSTVNYKGDGDGLADTYTANNWTYGNLTVNFTDTDDILDSSNTLSSGLQAYWQMDESSGNNVADSSGNGKNGTATATTAIVSGYTGNARQTDATNDSITFSEISMSGDFTVTAWANFPLVSSGQPRGLIAKSGGNYYPIIIHADGSLATYNAAWYYSGFDVDSLSAGWHHITAVGSGTATKYYIDGSFAGIAPSKVTQGVSILGNYTPGGNQYFGTMDEVRVYNRNLTGNEISDLGSGQTTSLLNKIYGNLTISRGTFKAPAANLSIAGNFTNNGTFNANGGTITFGSKPSSNTSTAVPTSGLTNYWKMDEYSGNPADSAGANTLTVSGPTIVDGKNSKGRNFVSGSSQYLYSGSNIGITGATTRSVSLWFKPGTTQGQQSLFGWGAAVNGTMFGLLYDITDEGLYFFGYNTDQAGNTNTITRSVWNHAVVTYDGTTVKVYINGNTTPDINAVKALNTTNSAIYLGKRLDSTFYYSGDIDEVRVYNTALTADQAAALYNEFPVPNNTDNSSTLSGSSSPAVTFNNLTANTSNKTLSFTSGQTFRVDGLLTLTGVTVNSSDKSTQWLINHQGTEAVTYTTVTNSGCDGSSTNITLVASDKNGGNNGTCWSWTSDPSPPINTRVKGNIRIEGNTRMGKN